MSPPLRSIQTRNVDVSTFISRFRLADVFARSGSCGVVCEEAEEAGEVAIDTETMGLNLQRDRLCLVQLSSGDGNAHLIQITTEALKKKEGFSNLKRSVKKINFKPKVILTAYQYFYSEKFKFWLAMRMLEKENKPLKDILKETMIVYVSVLGGDFVLQQVTPVANSLTSETTGAFTNDPQF